MPEVYRSSRFSIRIRNDHLPPHIHVRFSSGADATVDIRDCRIRSTELKTQEEREIRQFVLRHQDELMAAWERVWEGLPVERIVPRS